MKASYNGLLFLAENEGAVLCPYVDSVGVWTIGIGHTASAGPPDPQDVQGNLSMDEVLSLFATDIVKYEDRCNKYITVSVAQHEFDAAVSFDYNTGAIDSAFWVDSLNAGDRQAAGEQIMNWTSPPEVTSRRQREQNLFVHGDYDEPFVISVWEDYPGTPTAVTVPGADAAVAEYCPTCGQPLPT